MNCTKQLSKITYLILCSFILISCHNKELENRGSIIGWNILSDDMDDAERLLEKAKEYNVNQLQISHDIVHDLRMVRNPQKQKQVNYITNKAHDNGVESVLVWDHALYKLNYYPEKFIRDEDGKLDLDNEKFWEWFKS